MINLYRGLINILASQSRAQSDAFTKHIRSGCTDETLEPNQLGIGGFWNLLLEILFILFTKVVFFCGVLGVMVLAIIFFPLYGIKSGINGILNHRASFVDEINYQEPSMKGK
jgi:hypothetical protein